MFRKMFHVLVISDIRTLLLSDIKRYLLCSTATQLHNTSNLGYISHMVFPIGIEDWLLDAERCNEYE